MPVKNTGIDTYTRYMEEALGVPVEVIGNDKKLSPENFQKYIYSKIVNTYGIDEVIIEAPEAKASTLLLPREYRVHIRLHCPLSVAQKYDGFPINQKVYSEELRAINKAWKVSSPSYGLLEELKDEISVDNVNVFPNFPPQSKACKTEKIYDLVFLGRFQRLKGVDYLNSVMELLSAGKKVALAGPGSKEFDLSDSIFCDVDRIGYVEGEEKEDLLNSARYVFLASEFENCSMVALEAYSHHAKLIAWNVGGNPELYDERICRIVRKGDVRKVAHIINEDVLREAKAGDFKEVLQRINSEAVEGLSAVKSEIMKPYRKPVIEFVESKEDLTNVTFSDIRRKKLKVFGFSISNEHLEEMWMPALIAQNIDYYFVCRRKLGFHSKFDVKYDVNEEKFKCYDWLKQPHRLFGEIAREKPDFLLFHNGLHPMYQEILGQIKKTGIPIIYSELGWFPQNNNVYFDGLGVNASSNIASERSGVTNEADLKMPVTWVNRPVLLCLQMENDTNLLVASKRFKKNESLISYVIDQLPNETIVIRPHPDDPNILEYKKFESKRVLIDSFGSFEDAVNSVKAIVALNSTVILNALHYKVNIYALADGIATNKLGVIDSSKAHLSDLWLADHLRHENSRLNTIQFFKDRQVSTECTEYNSNQGIPNAFFPFSNLYASRERRWVFSKRFSGLKSMILKNNPDLLIKNYLGSIISEVDIANSLNKSSLRKTVVIKKKINKLKDKPGQFFKDSKFQSLRIIGKFIK